MAATTLRAAGFDLRHREPHRFPLRSSLASHARMTPMTASSAQSIAFMAPPLTT